MLSSRSKLGRDDVACSGKMGKVLPKSIVLSVDLAQKI
jgi:hypothetical protein